MKTDEIVEKYLKEGHTMEEFKELVMNAPINCSMCHRPKVYVDVYFDDHILKTFSLCPACVKLLDADPSFKDKVILKILQDKKYGVSYYS